MAKVKFSALVSDMSGKLNGSVFSRNRGGSYLRNKVTPINPQTSFQAKVRNIFGSISSGWKSLTEAQRKAWTSVVEQWKKTNIFGDLKTPSGNSLFVRLNANIIKAGGTMIDNPPMPAGVSGADEVSFDELSVANGISIDVEVPSITSNDKILVEMTPGMSPGISNAKNQFRIVEVLDYNQSFPYDIKTSYEERFGELAIGQKVFIRVSVVNILTGEESPQLSNSGIYTA